MARALTDQGFRRSCSGGATPLDPMLDVEIMAASQAAATAGGEEGR